MRSWPVLALVGLAVGTAVALGVAAVAGPTVVAGDPRLASRAGRLTLDGAPFTGVVEAATADQVERTPYVDGKRDGVVEARYGDGAIASTRHYRAGTKIGRHLGYWPNGTPQFERPFDDDGRYHGTLRTFYRDGQPHEIMQYAHGDEVGAQRSWSETGEIRANYVVRGGRRYGLVGAKPCFMVRAGEAS